MKKVLPLRTRNCKKETLIYVLFDKIRDVNKCGVARIVLDRHDHKTSRV